MRLYRVPSILFKLFPQMYWKYSTATDQVFLTFDDGPDPIFTPQILDILQREAVCASFFVLGCRAKQHSRLVQQIDQFGHTIGIHSFEHQRLFFQATPFIHEQLSKSKLIIEQIIQKSVQYFRPPYGIFSPRLVNVSNQLNLRLILWSVMSYDFDEDVSDKFILKLIETKTSGGDIIVFHDGHVKSDRTVKILGAVIKILKEKGLKLNSIHK
jgi:peptidoglycan/xylan/chitin deacetylase (PgdA/CDA1 family)